MTQKIESLRELFPSSMQKVDEILWTERSKLEKLCSLKELCEDHAVLQAENNIPEVGTRGIVWLPFFRIFPVVVSESNGKTFKATFEGLDARMKKDLDYFLHARETGVKKKRPSFLSRAFVRVLYLLEQRLSDIERRTFEPAEFPWSLEFENNFVAIRNEVQRIFDNVQVENIPKGLDKLSQIHSLMLAQQGTVDANAKKLLPTLARLLHNVPSLANAELSILAPGVELNLHKAGSRCFLRMHLGIIVPDGDICLELEGERLEWQEGKVMIFDDYYPHTAWNRTDKTRVILMVDLFRPMPKWQEHIFRLAQKKFIADIPKIPDEWLRW